jgi:hypothetical protein
MDDAEITDKLGLYSLHQRHWYIANTCAPAVYFYVLAMEEDPPDSNALHLGIKTDRIRTDITHIIFVFIFLFGFGFGHE